MPVTYRKVGHIGIVTLSRPKARNAWGADFNEGIARRFAAMEDDDQIRCAILTGDEAGGAFSAGANLKDPKTHTLASAAESSSASRSAGIAPSRSWGIFRSRSSAPSTAMRSASAAS